MELEDEHEDFWTKRMNISCGGYSEEVDSHIYRVAELIVEARESSTSVHNGEIALALGLTRAHVELIQYILASLQIPPPPGRPQYAECFTYGSSPRGLFVDDLGMANEFLREFKGYMKRWKP